MRVEAVLVDAGGVLVVPDPTRMGSALAPLGGSVDSDVTARAHYAGVAAVTRVGEGDPGAWKPYHRAYATACGVEEVYLDDAIAAIADEFLRPPVFTCVLPGAIDALRALAKLDLKIAIVTNSGGYAERLLSDLAICQVGAGPLAPVAAVIDSAIVGYEKPDPRIFELALEALGVEAHAAIHVGDTPAADVAGAIAAGITPVLIDPHDAHLDVACTRIRHLADVVPLVRP